MTKARPRQSADGPFSCQSARESEAPATQFTGSPVLSSHGNQASGAVRLRRVVTLRPRRSSPGQRFLEKSHLGSSTRIHFETRLLVGGLVGLGEGNVAVHVRPPVGPGCGT